MCKKSAFFCRMIFFLIHNLPFMLIHIWIPSWSQTIWTQIRPDIMSGLIWVQTVCKCYQQTTIAITSEVSFSHNPSHQKPTLFIRRSLTLRKSGEIERHGSSFITLYGGLQNCRFGRRQFVVIENKLIAPLPIKRYLGKSQLFRSCEKCIY